MMSCGAKEGDSGDKDDGFYMRRCVELARKAIGRTSPDPMVGCVIVKAGQTHAEVEFKVCLEPCNHYGRTPPCSEAMVKAKLKNVVIGMIDPNPIVASRGVQRLRDAGIDVVAGVEKELCKRLIEAFIHKMLTGKPFVTLRVIIFTDKEATEEPETAKKGIETVVLDQINLNRILEL
ncbi:hypothetical protein POTOM_047997 [Populus tomentosa]|uniref:CMP/dCMP-type deaminase domain-containing protein n=1 Tax=Populus tomentosa TaxID=118781 RepID=A0A8X7YFU0_POPTO|nr:hypothetical protein POTOM_047997 [Populus tomentosa]